MASTNDLNLRFGALALQCDFIDAQQFACACASWVKRDEGSLASVLAERGWLTAAQRAHVEQLLEAAQADESSSDVATLTLPGPASPKGSACLDFEIDLELDLDLDLDLDLEFDDLVTLGGPGSERAGDGMPFVCDRIKLRELHSSGGIGEVWRAFDEVLRREVALKRLKHDQADHADHRAHFLREAQITGQLEHPGIVPLYDYRCDDDGSRCFYTMRFVQGRTLSEVISAFHQRRIETGESLRSAAFFQLLEYFGSVCNTIGFAHSKGIVHRDLKGDNVVVGNFGEVVVLDWGLAKRLDAPEPAAAGDRAPSPAGPPSLVSVTSTMPGERLGTPAYMAPEQALGLNDRIDQRTDVYGLAAILYEILTSRPPFRGDDVLSVMDAVAHEPPSRPSKWVADVPLTLERICLRGLDKSMDARQQSVLELAAQVREWLSTLAGRDCARELV
ncbi:Serine/threonine protein kinase PrkC, regulator of stationary phase [Enhygromyxa salina]|uniref:Serine/threonine protein kinase PrkC, regulator of stationary phase n=1 Tax=Enhygromyxa salina TaxID=215803 RepID=A0A0C2CVG8_9BACT|nr:serine/threonine-protein kinase [Enhygromyxa salina]KIG13600.1 Serine/threonine protein kinase PrkC, regulator of stationary phase [Enhygromyxa salina]